MSNTQFRFEMKIHLVACSIRLCIALLVSCRLCWRVTTGCSNPLRRFEAAMLCRSAPWRGSGVYWCHCVLTHWCLRTPIFESCLEKALRRCSAAHGLRGSKPKNATAPDDKSSRSCPFTQRLHCNTLSNNLEYTHLLRPYVLCTYQL